VHGDYRPHTGVDYAAPAGTPVYAVADGEVILAQYKGGGGNTIYIQHAAGMKTGYLHLQKFASGIKVGKYVSQGDVIGYVGSTGTSTGPHLDYRIWQNGTPVDPLSLTQQPTEPIGDKYRADFERVRDFVIAELNGTGSYQITEDDIFHRN
jgi:murein DD-endopeptidase MepM/ murein hydrolase activator NlpD